MRTSTVNVELRVVLLTTMLCSVAACDSDNEALPPATATRTIAVTATATAPAVQTSTPVPATSTATRVAATATRTSTPILPTATGTATSAVPTATGTPTLPAPTATDTATPPEPSATSVATATPSSTCATAMIGTFTPTPSPDMTEDPTETPTCATPMPVTPGEFGSLINEEEFDSSPETLWPYAFGSGAPSPIPTRVVLENLPSVGQQGTARFPGSPGTCEAQAFGRGLGTYTAARLPDGTAKFIPNVPENTISAAFLWSIGVAEGIATCPTGGLVTPYLQRLVAYGSASEAQVPYEPSCCYLGGVDPIFPWPNQDMFRIGSYSTFPINAEQLEFMKYLIAAGHAIGFSGYVFDCYENPVLEFGVFGNNGGPQPPYRIPSGHGQLIVGFDDSMGNPAAPGAFLIQNSFGTDWPPAAPGGRIWWAYDTFFTSQRLAAVAYSVDPATPTTGQLQTQLSSPSGYVVGVNHWVEPLVPTNVYLIISLHFSAPVLLQQVTITEPGTGTSVTQEYGLPIGDGYVFIRRVDGAQFLSGTYGLVLSAMNAEAQQGEFSGEFTVGTSVPTTPTPAPIATPIFDTIGRTATVTSG